MATGIVKFFNQSKGYGFITPDDGGKDLFVHLSGITGGNLNDGDKVQFTVTQSDKGPQAVDVEIID
jgi:cold shock protein